MNTLSIRAAIKHASEVQQQAEAGLKVDRAEEASRSECPSCAALRSEIARIRKLAVDRLEEQRKRAGVAEGDCAALRARVAELEKALKKYKYPCNWRRSTLDGPIDTWICLTREGWNGPDYARAALAKKEDADAV